MSFPTHIARGKTRSATAELSLIFMLRSPMQATPTNHLTSQPTNRPTDRHSSLRMDGQWRGCMANDILILILFVALSNDDDITPCTSECRWALALVLPHIIHTAQQTDGVVVGGLSYFIISHSSKIDHVNRRRPAVNEPSSVLHWDAELKFQPSA